MIQVTNEELKTGMVLAKSVYRDNGELLLASGFLLLRVTTAGICEKALRLQEFGVRCVAPSHCTDSEAMKILTEVCGDRFIRSGVGRVIETASLVLKCSGFLTAVVVLTRAVAIVGQVKAYSYDYIRYLN